MLNWFCVLRLSRFFWSFRSFRLFNLIDIFKLLSLLNVFNSLLAFFDLHWCLHRNFCLDSKITLFLPTFHFSVKKIAEILRIILNFLWLFLLTAFVFHLHAIVDLLHHKLYFIHLAQILFVLLCLVQYFNLCLVNPVQLHQMVCFFFVSFLLCFLSLFFEILYSPQQVVFAVNWNINIRWLHQHFF